MKVSIIVPIYNVEKYLARCIDSLLNQDIPKEEYEIILVNDGSTDKSGDIARSYLNSNPHISYFEQQNQGQSVARNLGIDKAKGEYIWFVDSDDYILPNVLGKLYYIASINILEILFFQLNEVNNLREHQVCIQPIERQMIISGKDAIINNYNPSSACSYIVKKDLIINKNLRFKKGIYHEDVLFSYKLVAYASRIMFTEICPYIYFRHSNSTDSTTCPSKVIKRMTDNAIIAKELNRFAQNEVGDSILSNHIINHSKKINFGIVYNLYLNRKIWNQNKINSSIILNLRNLEVYPFHSPYLSIKHHLFSVLILNRSWWYK